MTGIAESNGTPTGSRVRLAAWSGAAGLLVLPLVAMQFTREVNWTLFDFVFAAAMIGGVGGAFELAVRTTRNTAYRAGAAIALAIAFLLIWINGAVGIIGSEHEDANLLFGGVLAVALLGAVVARFRAADMAWAMAAAALAQLAVPFVALTAWPEAAALVWSREVPIATAVFTGLWLLSAWLFRRSAGELATR
jgi:hypothetical protein